MLGPLVLAILLIVLSANAEARTIYTIAGGGDRRPPRLGEPAVPATSLAFEDVGLIVKKGRRFVIDDTLLLDERGMVRALPRPRGPFMLGTDRSGTEYAARRNSAQLFLRRTGGAYESVAPLPESSSDSLVHPDGGVLFAQLGQVVRVMPDGGVVRVAGTGVRGSSPDGGPARLARLRNPTDLAFAADGALLIADRDDNRVRRVDSLDGTISTVAGNGEQGFGGDGGRATSARLDWPTSLVVGRYGGLAIAETDDPRPRVRRVSRSGTIYTVAGGGSERAFGRGTSMLNGDGERAREGALSHPTSIQITPRDEYVFADLDLIRLVTSARTRRLALALRTLLPSRRRVSYAVTVRARLRLVVHGEGRRLVRIRTTRKAGLGFFRLPRTLPPGGYNVTLTATTPRGAVAVREAPMITSPRLSRRLAISTMHADEEERALITGQGVITLRRSLLGRATRCHRFGPRRVDCVLVDRIAQQCTIGAVRLNPRGQLYVGGYNCTDQGFERRPYRRGRWLDTPMPMLGFGP